MRTPRNTSVYIAVLASGATLLSTLTAAHAGPGDPPKGGVKPGPGKRMSGAGRMPQLNLTPAQTASMKAMQTEMMKKRTAITGNKALTPEQKRSQMQALMMSSMSKMMAVLTPEQKKMLQKQMTERRDEMMKTMKNRKGAAPVAPK